MSAKVWKNTQRGDCYYLVERWPGEKRVMTKLGPTEEDRLRGEESAGKLNALHTQRVTRAAALAAGKPVPGAVALRAWWDVAQGGRGENSRVTGAWLLEDHLIPYFGGIDLRRLSREHVQAFAGHMARSRGKRTGRPFAQHTIHDALSLLRRALFWLEGQHDLEFRIPLRFICGIGGEAAANLGAPKGERHSWTHEEADRLLECAALRGTALHDVVFAARHTGARKGELLGLEWDRVDFAGNRLLISRSLRRDETLKQPKNGKSRPVSMSPALHDLLWNLRQRIGKRHDRVFLDFDGAPWGYHRINEYWESARDRAHAIHGVRRLEFHCWRHSYVSWALAAGEDTAWIAKQIGDRLETMLRHYAHFVPGTESNHAFIDAAPASAARAPRQLRKSSGAAGA